jgi:nitroreductase
MMYMDLYEVIRTRRSVRKYRADPVAEDVLARVLDAARIAPSGSNRQPTRLIVVRDEETKSKLIPLCHDQAFVGDAPVVIVACGRDIKYDRGEWMGRYSMIVDVVIAVDHLTLAARAEGLGTCWIGSFNNERLKQFFSLPEDVDVVALATLGYPEGDAFADPEGRIPLDEFVSWGKWE